MIEIVDLRKRFDGVEVLRGVNLKIPTGKLTAIIGGSGVGKSVLLKHLVGLVKPDSGKILVDGVDITRLKGGELKKIKRRFGMVFQGGALFDSLTVLDNVAFPLRELTATPEEEIIRMCEEMLREMGLSGMDHKYPDELSGGMKKRVSLARALIMRPEFMFFDEPTTGLDPVVENAIHTLMKKCMSESRCTDVLVSHDIAEVMEVSDMVAMLHEGVIIENSPPGEFIKSTNPAVRQFLEGASEGPIHLY